MSKITKYSSTAVLRKEAKSQEIEGWEDMERDQLKDVLLNKEEDKVKEEKDTDSVSALPQEQKAVPDEDTKETSSTGNDSEADDSTTGEAAPNIIIPGVNESEYSKGSKAAKMKAHLMKQKKITIYIPLEGKEKPGTTFPVTLNGYQLNITKGMYVEVPKQVADVVMESQKQTRKATLENPMRINPDSKKASALQE